MSSSRVNRTLTHTRRALLAQALRATLDELSALEASGANHRTNAACWRQSSCCCRHHKVGSSWRTKRCCCCWWRVKLAIKLRVCSLNRLLCVVFNVFVRVKTFSPTSNALQHLEQTFSNSSFSSLCVSLFLSLSSFTRRLLQSLKPKATYRVHVFLCLSVCAALVLQ